MKEIQLTQGKIALVDDEDFDRVNQLKWCAQCIHTRKGWRAISNAPRVQGRGRTLYMHRFLVPGQIQIDHKDGNGLNNQKSNLRPATPSQNAANQRKLSKSSSVFKGVKWHRTGHCWQAQIGVNGAYVYLGVYASEADAAHVYDYAARIYFGEFARLNFP